MGLRIERRREEGKVKDEMKDKREKLREEREKIIFFHQLNPVATMVWKKTCFPRGTNYPENKLEGVS